MAAITDKQTLLASAATALVRTGFTQRIADSLPLAEAWLNRNLRLRMMESDEAVTATPASRTIALPATYLEPLALFLVDSAGRHELAFVAATMDTQVSSCRPTYWTVDGANIAFPAPCDSAYTFTFRMLERFNLTADGDTNALLSAWPDLYLMALLTAVAGIYLTDDPRLSAWKFTRDELLTEVRRKEARSRSLGTLGMDPALLRRRPFNIVTG